MWKHFVAIGDSFTAGIGDEVEGVELKSWAVSFAELFSPALPVTNLAKRGLIAKEIREQQLEQALSLKPDLVSIIAGANDVLKGRWNKEEYKEEMTKMVQAFSESGATIIIANLPNFTLRIPMPEEKKRAVQKQLEEANEVIESIRQSYEVIFFDMWSHPMATDPVYISADYVHPNSKGYQEIAQYVHEQVMQESL